MDKPTKDLIDAISKIGSVIGVFVAILLAYVQIGKNRLERKNYEDQRQADTEKDREQKERALEEAVNNREQRKEELRWRKAGLAREVLKELTDDSYVSDTMLMLDWSGREYTIAEGVVEKISKAEMWNALRVSNTDFTPKEKYVRDCFDHFFGMMQKIEHYIAINLVEFEDVEYPFNYYAGKLKAKRDVVETFLNEYEYNKSLKFLNRLANWK